MASDNGSRGLLSTQARATSETSECDGQVCPLCPTIQNVVAVVAQVIDQPCVLCAEQRLMGSRLSRSAGVGASSDVYLKLVMQLCCAHHGVTGCLTD